MQGQQRCVPVLCASLPSSASTWLFNAVADLLRQSSRRDTPPTVTQFYADDMDEFPTLDELPDYFVIKTHKASPTMRLIWRMTEGPIFITVREPRDAVASLMTRFEFTFDAALKLVRDAGKCVVELGRHGAPLVLRYEDRFFERKQTLTTVSRFLGIPVSPDTATDIFNSLSREAVSAKIEDLTEQGVLSGGPPSEIFDPQTHWHPRHLGSGESGKHSDVLSPWQQARVMLDTAEFCRASGYPLELPPGYSQSLFDKDRPYLIGEPLLFGRDHDTAHVLTEGWDNPEDNLVCALDQRSLITLEIGDLPAIPKTYQLRIGVRPFRTDTLQSRLIAVFVNGTFLLEDRIETPTTMDVAVPRDVLAAEQPAVITLLHPDAASPSDYEPSSADARMLSFLMVSLEILADDSASKNETAPNLVGFAEAPTAQP